MSDPHERYHRQTLLSGFGKDGQHRLLASTVLIAGCGALGSMLADMLARAGVGHLIIVDRDFVELTNLQRQVLFDEHDVELALPKAEAARQKIGRINNQVKVTAVVDDLNHTNIEQLAFPLRGEPGTSGPVDVIVDGLDNFETRFLLNDCAVKHGIPYVYGGAVGTTGMTLAILPHTEGGVSPWERSGHATPCLRCLFEQPPPPGMNPTCDTVGVLGPLVANVASHEATEAMKVLTGNWDAINPTMQHLDLWENRFHQFDVGNAYKGGHCRCCKQRRFDFLDGHAVSGTTTLCGRNAVQFRPKATNIAIPFEEIAERLRRHGSVKCNDFMLLAHIADQGKPYELSLFPDGRVIVKGTKKTSVAKSIYAKYVGG